MNNLYPTYLKINSLCKKIFTNYSKNNRVFHGGFQQLRCEYYANLWREISMDVGASCEQIHENYFRISRGNKDTFVNLYNVMLDNHLVLNMAGDKSLTFKLLKEQGFENIIPKFITYDLVNIKKAYKFINEVKSSVVVKPSQNGYGGHGVTTNVTNIKELRQASINASIYSSKLQIEKQICGDSFRLLFFQGNFIEAIKRKRPTITGDGKKSIKDLIFHENNKRLKDKPILSLSPLTSDLDHLFFLKTLKLKQSSILNFDEMIEIKGASNQNQKRENIFIDYAVDSSIISQCKQIIINLKITLAGIDIITPDITKPLAEVNGILCEINTTPGLHHHYLVANRNNSTIGNLILDYLLK